jgi:predicted  nucleic acid-binding Zn-ribbon protein
MTIDPLVDQRLRVVEDNQRTQQDDIKEIKKIINDHDKSIVKIEFITENMGRDWSQHKSDIKSMFEQQTQLMNETNKTLIDAQSQSNTSVLSIIKDGIIELVKGLILVTLAILGMKATGKL